MAGAGYKLFNTGDVLTAAQVNTYLMEQTVMVFANAAARTTALSGVVSEGMISYLKDTNAVEVYDGSNWVSSDDPNAIQNTIVDAKGDLISASAADVPARLAVGNNGETLVADSSASTGLRWQGNYAAGKNKIINGDFGIWQRGTSFTMTNGVAAYTADRFSAYFTFSSGSASVSRQAFTAGTAPVSGYEGTYFLRATKPAVNGYCIINQPIEDVRTFAGQTITVSFWAKVNSGTITSTMYVRQRFGSGGSADVNYGAYNYTVTTSWQRFTQTITLASVAGKTIGAGSSLTIDPIFNLDSNGYDIDIWGLQVEAGNTATAFQTATSTLAGELQAAMRYYQKSYSQATAPATATSVGSINGINTSTTLVAGLGRFPVVMRTAPTVTLYSSADGATGQIRSGGANIAGTPSDVSDGAIGYIAATGLTANSNSTIQYALNSEL